MRIVFAANNEKYIHREVYTKEAIDIFLEDRELEIRSGEKSEKIRLNKKEAKSVIEGMKERADINSNFKLSVLEKPVCEMNINVIVAGKSMMFFEFYQPPKAKKGAGFFCREESLVLEMKKKIDNFKKEWNMKLTFIGAAHEVTGSCNYLEACGKKILIDCGMEQGKDIYENIEIPVLYSEIDYVFLTHAHIDHAGHLPLIYAKGFKGKILATQATCDLCEIMLEDSAHIQEFEAKWKTRKAKRSGREEVFPLYTLEDAKGVQKHFVPCDYDKTIDVFEGVKIRFADAGHLLGSASIEVCIREKNISKKIVFSGDIGNVNKPIIRNPEYLNQADYVVMESTYGDRRHPEWKNQIPQIAEIIKRTFDRGGNLVIPAFAVGRTQELLYYIREIKEKNMVEGYEGFEVYVDSPLANKATNVFTKNLIECFDDETRELLEKGINPLTFPGLKTAVSSEESMQINFISHPKVIISASGMCDAGRIRHHLKHNLWREESTVMFTGYQANGTLGRNILDGQKQVRIFGEEIEVKAEIVLVEGMSGHADVDGLERWVGNFKEKPKRVICSSWK